MPSPKCAFLHASLSRTCHIFATKARSPEESQSETDTVQCRKGNMRHGFKLRASHN